MKTYFLILLTIFSLACSKSIYQETIKESKFLDLSTSDGQLKISKYEVTNLQFRHFLNEEGNGKFAYDSLKWGVIEPGINQPFIKNYHWHPAYYNYPVVNITHEAAEAYCNWLTKNYKGNGGEVLFRLPTKEEMAKLITERQQSLFSNFHTAYECDLVANLKYKNLDDSNENYATDGCLYTCNVEIYEQNGLCSLLGNVSEICQTGQALGGNWYSFPTEINENTNIPLPDPRVGFRVIMEKK